MSVSFLVVHMVDLTIYRLSGPRRERK
jgi:hypothetical protein